ncbi:MAG: hypothetical protein RLZZ628_1956 [Bacteroidota bacterium]|jgi:hypothetical protein
MQTIEVKKGIEALAQRVAILDLQDLTTFFEQLNAQLSGYPKIQRLHEEAILLKKLKTVMPRTIVRRYRALRSIELKQGISEKERQEMIWLSDVMEAKSLERVHLLAALAQLRQMSLADLVKQYPIRTGNPFERT